VGAALEARCPHRGSGYRETLSAAHAVSTNGTRGARRYGQTLPAVQAAMDKHYLRLTPYRQTLPAAHAAMDKRYAVAEQSFHHGSPGGHQILFTGTAAEPVYIIWSPRRNPTTKFSLPGETN